MSLGELLHHALPLGCFGVGHFWSMLLPEMRRLCRASIFDVVNHAAPSRIRPPVPRRSCRLVLRPANRTYAGRMPPGLPSTGRERLIQAHRRTHFGADAMTRQNIEAGRHRASCCSLVMAIARGERPTVSEEDFATVLAAAGKTVAEFSADVERLITLETDREAPRAFAAGQHRPSGAHGQGRGASSQLNEGIKAMATITEAA